MQRIPFNDDWQVKKEDAAHAAHSLVTDVVLPHDAMFEAGRDSSAWNGTKKAFFANGAWEYTKQFDVPEEWRNRNVLLEFEGVYNRAKVFINEGFAGHRPYGYSEFHVIANDFLRYGQINKIKVTVQTGDDSRWYTGAGLYRNVNLLVSDLTHIPANGLRITTESATSAKAVISVRTQIVNMRHVSYTLRVKTLIFDPDGHLAASDTAPVTLGSGQEQGVSQRMCLSCPGLWDVDNPSLYTCRTTLWLDAEVIDSAEIRFGIRILGLDSVDGLQLNGKTVKLRGCCIHHDNGIIGARTFASAEYRRIKKLKEAGFNAIRSAHHPISRALLEACDKIGMLVMDEAFDIWNTGKSSDDYSVHFPDWWERDVEAMVAKDYNHPSVIMYSIGNEVPDVAVPHGANWGRAIAERIKALDRTRYTTNSINGIMSILSRIDELITADKKNMEFSGQDVNATMSGLICQGLDAAASLPEIAAATEESFATVDIAGYNYMSGRYEMDKELYPNRIIVGSETYTAMIGDSWEKITNNAHVIGDFAWTGWDYLGETGIGRISYEPRSIHEGFYGEYPWTTAWCGDFDITGFRLPASYYREIVFGIRSHPYIAVQRPDCYSATPYHSPWSFADVLSTWSFAGSEGKPVRVEVYAKTGEVELLINGKTVGRQKIGEIRAFTAIFETVYIPGKVEAVVYESSKETGRFALQSAREVFRLNVIPEKQSLDNNGHDLAFVNITLTDDGGIVHHGNDRTVRFQVEGAGRLIGFGSGAPEVTESYLDEVCATYNGRALAVLLPSGIGVIKVTAEAEGCLAVTKEIEVINDNL